MQSGIEGGEYTMMSASDLTGEKLAAAVAEKVMGWTCRHDGMADKWFKPDGKWEYVVKHYHPDLNIAQAWDVVAALADWRGHVWQDADRLWWARFDHINSLTCTIPILPDGSLAPPIRSSVASDANPCVAICRAALAAVETVSA